MAETHRLSTTGALIVCLVGTQCSGTLFASEQEPTSWSEAPSSQPVVNSSSATLETTSTRRVTISVESIGQQPDGATDPSSGALATAARSRFTLDDEVLAANAPAGPGSARVWRSAFELTPVESTSFAQRGWGRGRGGRHGGAQAALVLGAVGTIAGAAVLVYANRPACSTNQNANGCGYGTKVVGGAVLAAGIFGFVVAALTWR
jgi:hypothetical protein